MRGTSYRTATLLLAGVAFGTPAAVLADAAPAFNCGQAAGEVEQLICRDAELAALDRRMSSVWAKTVQALPADVAAREKVVQRGWIKGRNDCWKASDLRACVETSYETRLVELQIKVGQLQAPTAAGYLCSQDPGKPFTASFYNDTDPKSAVLTWGNDQVIAFVAMSASGARYTTTDVEFWEHQGEARVSWFGTRLTCKLQR
jgi:uncharacterized protein